jgi:phospholipid transport system substrate-binding protein
MSGGIMKRFVAAVVVISLLGFAILARAETLVAPEVLVKNAVQEVLTAIKQGKSDKKQIQDLVDARVLPVFDFTLMTKRTVDRQAWKDATPEQKKMLVEQFRDLLLRSYIGKAFGASKNVTVKFEPTQYAESDDQVTVKTQINTPGDAPLAVEYDLKKTSAGWRVVDFSVAGPRLALEMYSGQFRVPLQQSGIDGVIKFLVDKNHAAENVVASARKADAK